MGTGLGGGVIEAGRVVKGAAGHGRRAGPRAHPDGRACSAPGQPVPRCNCGFVGDAESVASLTGIEQNLLPYWLARFPDHELRRRAAGPGGQAGPRRTASRATRWRCKIFEQQAMALGRLFTIAANFTDPHAYFVGGGVVEAAPEFRDWFLALVREQHVAARAEQARVASFALVPDLDMAGARGAAVAAWEALAA